MLCVLLEVPGKCSCGEKNDLWNRERLEKYLRIRKRQKTTFVLPLAVIIETGNHICHATDRRYETARRLSKIIHKAVDQESPWALFAKHSELWNDESLKKLAEEWPDYAKIGLSISDCSIKDIAEHYSLSGCEVEILTGDKGLKSYQPVVVPKKPRRRSSPR